jgi:type IV pilus assembly protein PilB
MDRKIITVEDPIEYAIDGVVQGQIGEKGGLSYKNFVKSMRRQDPDVIVVGEIRDKDSADAVVETSLTGHKVLTSFHTEESTGALMRLFEMGVETFLITSTVVSVLTQRLARTLCMHCREPYEPSQEILDAFPSIKPIDASAYTFFAPTGCVECENTGFSGRTALSEVLVVNNQIRDSILKRAPTGVIREAARATTNMISLQEDGFYKATKGITSLEEILRLVACHESDTKRALSSEQIVSMCEGGSKSYSTTERGGSSSIYSMSDR